MFSTVFSALVTISIIYHRILHAELRSKANSAVIAEPDNRVVVPTTLSVSRFVALQLRTVAQSAQSLEEYAHLSSILGAGGGMLSALLQVETDLVEQLGIPAFECAQLGGSFLKFLSRQLSVASQVSREGELGLAAHLLNDSFRHLYLLLCGHDGDARDEAARHGGGGAHLISGSLDLPSMEALLQAITMQLSAAVGSLEFQLTTSSYSQPNGLGENTQQLTPVQLFTELLLKVEQGLERDGLILSVREGGPSLLSLIDNLGKIDLDLSARINKILFSAAGADHSLVRTTADNSISSEARHTVRNYISFFES